MKCANCLGEDILSCNCDREELGAALSAIMMRRDEWIEEVARLEAHCKRMKDSCIELDGLFERLDYAMATPECIAEHTKIVGGFVSSLYQTEMHENIVNRAIAIIKAWRRSV